MALDLLCKLLSTSTTELAVADYSTNSDYDTLLRLGFIEDNLVLSAVVCDECDDAHSAAIQFCQERQAYGWDCYDHGFIAKTRADLLGFRINVDNVVKCLAEALNSDPRHRRRVRENISFVGRFYFAERDISIYLLTSPVIDHSEVARAVASEPRHDTKLLLSSTLDDVPGLNIDGATFARLDKAIRLDPRDGIVTERNRLANLAGVESTRPLGRMRHPQRAEIAEIIREFRHDGKTFRSKRAASTAIEKAMNARFPDSKAPGRTVIEDEIDTSEFGCFLVGK